MENWKDIEGYEGYYQVSDHGRIKSLDRYVPHKTLGSQFVKGRILSLKRIDKHRDYMGVCLAKFGKRTNHNVHSLVAKAFVPNDNPKINNCALHIIPDRTNNKPSNLKWGTYLENNRQRVSDGNDFDAKKTHCPLGAPLDYLVPGDLKRNKRNCQACLLTRCYLRRHSVEKQLLHDLLYQYKSGTRGLKKMNLLPKEDNVPDN